MCGYLSVALVLSGWAVLLFAVGLFAYMLLGVVAFNLRVIQYEEPMLARQFGVEWEDYASRVHRWLW